MIGVIKCDEDGICREQYIYSYEPGDEDAIIRAIRKDSRDSELSLTTLEANLLIHRILNPELAEIR